MKTIKKKETLLVEGMTCSNCASGIQKHLKSNGLEDVTVNFSTSEANFFADKISKNEVIKLIESLGYSIKKESEKEKMSLQEKLFYFS
ncbi:MAG: cation transporter, partial [Flavobacteriales bacterium]